MSSSSAGRDEITEMLMRCSIVNIEEYLIVPLEDDELFRYADGSVIDVEVRGKRLKENVKVLAKAEDIARFFELPHLISCVMRKVRPTSSKICECVLTQPSRNKNIERDTVFLTSPGMMEAYHVSKTLKNDQAYGEIYLIRLDERSYEFGTSWYFKDAGCDSIDIMYSAKVDMNKYFKAESDMKKYLEANGWYRSTRIAGVLFELDDNNLEQVKKFYDHLQDKFFFNIPYSPPVVDENLSTIFIKIEQRLRVDLKYIQFEDLELLAQSRFLKKEIQLRDAHAKEIIELKYAHADKMFKLKNTCAELKYAHAKENAENVNKIHELKLQLICKDMEIQTLEQRDQKRRRMESKAIAPDLDQLESDEIMDDPRTLVCKIKGTHVKIVTITINADAPIRKLKKTIYKENVAELRNIIFPDMLDVRLTTKRTDEWTRFDEDGCIVMRSKKCVKDYFPSCPVHNSDVVDIIVEAAPTFLNRISLPRDLRSRERSDKEIQAEYELQSRIKKELGLFLHWSISGTDFSRQHDFPTAKWLEFEHCPNDDRARVSIDQAKTWRDLYIACNDCVRLAEGEECESRFVELFYLSDDGLTLELNIGT